MPVSNERVFWLTLTVFIPLAIAIILWKNSEWFLEVRSLKELRFMEVDGFIAPLFLIAAFPVTTIVRDIVVRFNICEKIYAELFVVLTVISFSIGFSISAFRQTNIAGRLVAAITLLVCGVIILLALDIRQKYELSPDIISPFGFSGSRFFR